MSRGIAAIRTGCQLRDDQRGESIAHAQLPAVGSAIADQYRRRLLAADSLCSVIGVVVYRVMIFLYIEWDEDETWCSDDNRHLLSIASCKGR